MYIIVDASSSGTDQTRRYTREKDTQRNRSVNIARTLFTLNLSANAKAELTQNNIYRYYGFILVWGWTIYCDLSKLCTAGGCHFRLRLKAYFSLSPDVFFSSATLSSFFFTLRFPKACRAFYNLNVFFFWSSSASFIFLLRGRENFFETTVKPHSVDFLATGRSARSFISSPRCDIEHTHQQMDESCDGWGRSARNGWRISSPAMNVSLAWTFLTGRLFRFLKKRFLILWKSYDIYMWALIISV